jgi:hypothetical protein
MDKVVTIFESLPPEVNVTVGILVGAWCVFTSTKATCSIGRITFASLGCAFLFGGGVIWGIEAVLEGWL